MTTETLLQIVALAFQLASWNSNNYVLLTIAIGFLWLTFAF